MQSLLLGLFEITENWSRGGFLEKHHRLHSAPGTGAMPPCWPRRAMPPCWPRRAMPLPGPPSPASTRRNPTTPWTPTSPSLSLSRALTLTLEMSSAPAAAHRSTTPSPGTAPGKSQTEESFTASSSLFPPTESSRGALDRRRGPHPSRLRPPRQRGQPPSSVPLRLHRPRPHHRGEHPVLRDLLSLFLPL